MDYSSSMTPLLMNIIATKQGELFEYAENKGHNMTNFITQYMLSNFCNQEMDSDYSYFYSDGIKTSICRYLVAVIILGIFAIIRRNDIIILYAYIKDKYIKKSPQ